MCANVSDRHGLADGFTAYLVPTPEDYTAALRSGIVALDANVLLNAYRYHERTRADLFTILEALGDRLFVPHQAAKEFWRNREATIREALGATKQLRQDLEHASDRSSEALARWAKRSGLADELKIELTGYLDTAYAKVLDRVDQLGDDEIGTQVLDTSSDPVLSRLLLILSSAVGGPFAAGDQDEHSREAARRIEAKEPPGFKDGGKPGADSHGDYLLWRQVLDVAADRSADVVFVTGDLKDDWWRREGGETRGPRLELLEEFALSTNGRQLFILRPANLIKRAKDALSIEIRQDSVEAAERIDHFSFDRDRRDYYGAGDLHSLVKLPGGRSGSYLRTLVQMTELVADGPTYDELIDRFQEAFPSITLPAEARRRVGILGSLGLAEFGSDSAKLTEAGKRFLETQDLVLLQELFMARIGGAAEVRRLASVASLNQVRKHLRHDPPEGLSPTQASLALRWMEQLELID